MYICTQQYAFEAVEKKQGRGRMKSLSWVFSFPLFQQQFIYRNVMRETWFEGGIWPKFSIRVGTEMDRSGRWANCRWACVSRPRRRGPTERWWTPGPRPPPAVGWCHQSRCWWWSGQSSERRSPAASPIPSAAVAESHPEGVMEKERERVFNVWFCCICVLWYVLQGPSCGLVLYVHTLTNI